MRRRPTEEEMYEQELQSLLSRRQQQSSHERQSASAESGQSAVDDDGSGGLPEVADFFDINYGDWSDDPDIARLRLEASLDSNRRADNGGSSLHNIHIHRILRVKEAVRDVLPDVIRSHSSSAAARVDLTSLPLLMTRVRVSSDVQWVSVYWTLVPYAADSSLCRLPASMAGMKLHAALALVASQLTSCIAPMRLALSGLLALRYVPHVRFVYEGSEWRRRLRDRQRVAEVEERLTNSGESATDSSASNSSSSEPPDLVEAGVDFHRFNPFSSSPPRPRAYRVSAQKRSSSGAASIVSEQRPPREKRRSSQQRQQRRALAEMKRTGVVNGEWRYARPVVKQQAATGSRPRHVKKDEEWIRQQQRALWESQS